MKQLHLLCLFSILWFTSNSQCSVTQSKGSHSTTYINKFEEVFVNKDLENGVNKYDLRLILNKDTSTSVPVYIMMECRYTNSGTYKQDECAPRSIVFKFSDGTNGGPILALTEGEQKILNGFQSRVFTYEIAPQTANLLSFGKLQNIYFADKRTGNMLEAKFYPELLKEQLECLTALSRNQ